MEDMIVVGLCSSSLSGGARVAPLLNLAGQGGAMASQECLVYPVSDSPLKITYVPLWSRGSGRSWESWNVPGVLLRVSESDCCGTGIIRQGLHSKSEMDGDGTQLLTLPYFLHISSTFRPIVSGAFV